MRIHAYKVMKIQGDMDVEIHGSLDVEIPAFKIYKDLRIHGSADS